MLEISILDMSLKIIDLRLQLDLPGVNELSSLPLLFAVSTKAEDLQGE